MNFLCASHKDQDVRIQCLEQNMIKLTVVIEKGLEDRNARFDMMIAKVIQKGMDESNALFDRTLKEMTDHKDGTT